MPNAIVEKTAQDVFSEYPEKMDAYFTKNITTIRVLPDNIDPCIEKLTSNFQITSASQYIGYLQNELSFWKEHDAYFKERDSRCADLEKLYQEKLRLEAPAEYWKELDKQYNRAGWIWFVFSVLFTAGIIIAEDAETYLANSGQFDAEGNRLVQNTESNGRFHTDWLNMIYPRLKLAKDLLTDDGVIFISINDCERDSLKKCCDEVWGECNFVASMIWQQRKGGGNDSKYIAVDHEYVLIYAKNTECLPAKWRVAAVLSVELHDCVSCTCRT